jgi:hypothetical protein
MVSQGYQGVCTTYQPVSQPSPSALRSEADPRRHCSSECRQKPIEGALRIMRRLACAARLLDDLLRARAAQAVGNQAQLALKEFDPREHTAIVAEAVFVERGINLFGQPQWIVAVIFDTGVGVPTCW